MGYITELVDGGINSSAMLADDVVISSKISDSAVTTDKIAPLAVTAAKIAANTITSGQIADDAVETNKIVNLAVTAAKIAASTITSAQLADDAIITAKITDLAVTADKIANETITPGKLSFAVQSVTYSELTPATDNPTSNLSISTGTLVDASSGSWTGDLTLTLPEITSTSDNGKAVEVAHMTGSLGVRSIIIQAHANNSNSIRGGSSASIETDYDSRHFVAFYDGSAGHWLMS